MLNVTIAINCDSWRCSSRLVYRGELGHSWTVVYAGACDLAHQQEWHIDSTNPHRARFFCPEHSPERKPR